MPSRSKRKIWRSLHRRKGRERAGLFLLEGPILLAEALGSEVRLESVLVAKGARDEPAIRALIERCEGRGVECETVGDREFSRLVATVTPQGIAAAARVPEATWRQLSPRRLLVLDAVQDPGNVGTLIRTAEASGLGGVICLPGTADPWSPKVTRAAAGSTLRVPVLLEAWEVVLKRLRAADTALWAADPNGEPVGRGEPTPAALALVVGNEGAGVSRPVLSAADRRVAVRMKGPVESLNVAVAAAILIDRIFGE